MGSILDKLKEGIGALNPMGTKVDNKPVTPPSPKLLGPKGVPTRDVAEQAKKRNKATQDVADTVQ